MEETESNQFDQRALVCISTQSSHEESRRESIEVRLRIVMTEC